MNNKRKGRLSTSRLQALLTGACLFAGLGLLATSADATITGSVGGVPSGAGVYENFDNVPLGAATFTTSSGIVVSFGNDGQAVQGALSGQYAAPFLSGGNGSMFGSQPDGADTTTYLASGSTNYHQDANVTLSFLGPGLGPQNYLGLLWGSVDAYNTLTFYDILNNVVGTFTGLDVTAAANGDQGKNGTFYVNINLTDSFTKVVATSSSYAFEFDNVAINSRPIGTQFSVPEPGSAGVFLLGLLLVGSAFSLKRRRLS